MVLAGPIQEQDLHAPSYGTFHRLWPDALQFVPNLECYVAGWRIHAAAHDARRI